MSAESADYQLQEHAIGMANIANEQLDGANQASREVERIERELEAARGKAAEANESYHYARHLADKAVEAAYNDREGVIDHATEEDLGFTLIGSDNKEAPVSGSSRNDPKEALLTRLSKETAARIRVVGTALAEKYDLSPEDIGVVIVKEEPKDRFSSPESKIVVVDIANKGLAAGSYNEIMQPVDESQYILEVDGKKYDTRQGMTWSTYKNLWWGGEADAHLLGTRDPRLHKKIEDWRKRFDTQMSDNGPCYVTLLTGESLEGNTISSYDGKASYGRAYISGRRADRAACSPDSTHERRDTISQYELRFRPAVVIK